MRWPDLPAGFGPVRATEPEQDAERGAHARAPGRRGAERGLSSFDCWGARRACRFRELVEAARRQKQLLLVVSGAGSADPELTAASTVPPAVVHEATAYLQLGGRDNFAHCLRFLSDHLLLTGFGYEPPRDMRQHGIYHPDGADGDAGHWLARRIPSGRPWGCCSIGPIG